MHGCRSGRARAGDLGSRRAPAVGGVHLGPACAAPLYSENRSFGFESHEPGGNRMRTEDLILVSVDDHVVEPPSLGDFFAEHVAAKYKDRVPRVIRRDDGSDAWLIEGKEIASFGLNAVQGRPPENWGSDPASFDQVRPGCYDVHERIRDMNVNGVLASHQLPVVAGARRPVLRAERRQRLRGGDDPRLQRLAHPRVVRRVPGPVHPARALRLHPRRRLHGRGDPPSGRAGLPRGVVPRRAAPLRHARPPRRRVGPRAGRRVRTPAP